MSGPDSLDALRKSFLSPYLPAELAGPRELREADFAELNQHWTLSSRKGASRPLTLLGPWSGVKLQSQPDARFLRHSGDLLIERRVGRGRIVVSAFHLAGRELTSWPGWDNMVNACLLRRLPRHYYRERKEDRLEVDWAGSYDTAPASAHQPGHKLDPRFITHLLYTARDAGVAWDRLAPDLGADPAVIDDRQLAATLANDESRPHPGGGQTGGPGVAAWNDFSPVAQTARQLLAEAARVQVPPRSFVVGIVAIYLMVLVPVNWGIFRLLRRVEWAWRPRRSLLSHAPPW